MFYALKAICYYEYLIESWQYFLLLNQRKSISRRTNNNWFWISNRGKICKFKLFINISRSYWINSNNSRIFLLCDLNLNIINSLGKYIEQAYVLQKSFIQTAVVVIRADWVKWFNPGSSSEIVEFWFILSQFWVSNVIGMRIPPSVLST